MKLKVPEPLLTQPVETPSSPDQPEGLPLDDKRLDPILEQAVESQPEVSQPEPPPAPVVSRCMCKRLCTGGIPLLEHLLQRLPRLREPLEPQDVRFAKQLASPTQDTG